MCHPVSLSKSICFMQRHIAEKLGLEEKDVDSRLGEVTTLLPGLMSRLPNIKASTVAQLCANPRVRRISVG